MHRMGNRQAPARARWIRTVAAGATVAVVGALLSSVTGSARAAEPVGRHVGPEIDAEVATLRADLQRVAQRYAGSKTALRAADASALDVQLRTASADAVEQTCAATASLQQFTERAALLAAKARQEERLEAAKHADAASLAELRNTTGAYADLETKAAAIRSKLLASFPDDDGCAGPVTVVVDAAKAKSGRDALPALVGTAPRPIASIVDTDSVEAHFVADELVVAPADDAELQALLARWGGTVLQKFDPKLDGMTLEYLVRIDTKRADTLKLSANLATLNPDKTKADALAVSSQEGLELLAAASAEVSAQASQKPGDQPGAEKPSVTQPKVSVNWVASTNTIEGGSTREAATGPAGYNNDPTTEYSRDAFDWSHLNAGSVQNIGVTEAWKLLDRIGRLKSNEVEVGIIDEGFKTSVDDLPATEKMSVVPFVGADDPSIEGGIKRWHGAMVASAGFGVPDNGRGVAGPGGPVAKLNEVWSFYDMFTSRNGISRAVLAGSKIINMSFGIGVHWSLEWSLAPFELYTTLLRATDQVVLLAAAGNEGKNVDRETCFIVCWESHLYYPCENGGVRCVGGLASNTRNRASLSNYGHEDVDIFAPFHHLHAATPDFPEDKAHPQIGTSLSTPYVAGVAALIWAARPGLNADGVESILFRTMRSSPDDKVRRRVIHAYGAVTDALPAVIEIKEPRAGATLPAGPPQRLRAAVYSDGHGTPTITWRRGSTVLGTGHTTSAVLPPGTYDIIATAAFPDGVTATDNVRVTVVNRAPTVQILGPRNADGSTPSFGRTEPILFRGSSSDETGRLADSQVTWHIDGQAAPFATGHTVQISPGVAPGQHTVTFRGCDAFGACAVETVPIVIRPDGPNQAPSVRITNPANGAWLNVNGSDTDGYYHQITLQSAVSDPDGDQVTVKWMDNGTLIATGPNPTVRLRGQCETYGHRLTVIATDSAGNSRQDTVDVVVGMVC